MNSKQRPSRFEKRGISSARDGATPRISLGVIIAFFVVAASYVINAMDRLVFPQFVRTINQEFHFTLAQGGLLATIYALGVAIAGVPSGYFVDRWSRRGTAMVGIIIYSAMTILIVISLGFWDMAAYRTFSGFGEAMQQTAIFTIFGAYFYRTRALALGTLNAAYGIGAFLGPVLGIQVFLHSSDSWRMPMIVFGLAGFVLLLVFFVSVPRNFSEAAAPTQAADTHDVAVESHVPTRCINRNVLILSVTNVVAGLAQFGYLGLYPTFLKSFLAYTPEQAAFAAGMFGLGAFMGIPAGWIGDRVRQKHLVLGCFIGSIITYYLIFEVARLPWQQDILSFLTGTFGSAFLFVILYALTQCSMRREYVGRASGVASTARNLPAAFAGLIFGYFATKWGWHAAAFGLVLVQILGFLTMLWLREDQLYNPRRAVLNPS